MCLTIVSLPASRKKFCKPDSWTACNLAFQRMYACTWAHWRLNAASTTCMRAFCIGLAPGQTTHPSERFAPCSGTSSSGAVKRLPSGALCWRVFKEKDGNADGWWGVGGFKTVANIHVHLQKCCVTFGFTLFLCMHRWIYNMRVLRFHTWIDEHTTH